MINDCSCEHSCLFLKVHDANSLIHQDEGKFDHRSIPLKSWNDYVGFSCTLPYPFVNTLHQENKLWDKELNHSIGSWVPQPKSKEAYADSCTASSYG